MTVLIIYGIDNKMRVYMPLVYMRGYQNFMPFQEITAMIGASAAVSISDVPFNGPIAGIARYGFSPYRCFFHVKSVKNHANCG